MFFAKVLNILVTMYNIRDHLLPFERSFRLFILVGPHCTALGHNSNNTTCIMGDHCLSCTTATSRDQNCFNVGPMYPTLAQQQPSIDPISLTVSVPRQHGAGHYRGDHTPPFTWDALRPASLTLAQQQPNHGSTWWATAWSWSCGHGHRMLRDGGGAPFPKTALPPR